MTETNESGQGDKRAELTERLQTLGLDDGSYRVLMLLPLIYVAWADGKMERVEIDRIHTFAQARLHFSKATTQVLDRWLAEPPSIAYVETGLQSLLDVALDPEILEVDTSELQDLLMHAEGIARATADALDDPNAVTPEEDAALKEIAELLQVDSGTTWKQILEEVRSQRRPTLTHG